MPILDRLLYDAGIDVSSFQRSGEEIKRQLSELGGAATKTFEQDFGRALAKAVDPANIKQGLDRSRQILSNFGDDARRSFEKTFQREGARRIFQPFVDESKTFTGQLKQQFRDAFDIKKVAIGSLAGILSANVVSDIVGGLFNIGKATTQLAADAVETRSKFNIVFGDLADDTRAFANSFADSVGRARVDTEQFLASFQGLLEPMGLTNEQAAEFSKTLTKLAVDVASFNNQLDADVVRDFQSALTGETEPVKKYGIVLNETRLKQEALNQGLITTGQTLTDQQKLYLRYQILLKDTTAAQGDAIRTSDSLVNQQKALNANLKNLGETIGAAVVPAISAVVGALNDLFSSATPMEKLVTDLQKLGIAAEELNFLSVVAQSERAQQSIDELDERINKLLETTDFLGDSLIKFGRRGIIGSFLGGETVGDVAQGFLDIANQADGLNKLQIEIGNSTQRILDLTRQIIAIREGRQVGDEAQIRSEIELERERVRIAGDVLQFSKAIAAQERIIAENTKQQTETVLEAVTVEAKRVKLAEQTTKELKAMLEANKGNRKEIEKELAEREKTLKFIQEIRQQLEKIGEQDDVGRKLTQIRQEAEERRKIYSDNTEAIRLINRLEREERRKTLDEFENRLREQVRQRIQQIVNIDFQPQLITTLSIPEIKIDTQEARTVSNRISSELNNALLSTPASILLNAISNLGPLIDEELINFVGIIDKRFADILAGVANFAASLSSGNILGAITGAIGVIGRLFGGDGGARRAEEATRKQAQAQEEAARAADKARESLENLRHAADEFSAGRFVEDIQKLNDEFLKLSNGTKDLTTEEQQLANQLIERINLTKATIAGLEAERRVTTDPERLREIEEELIKQNALLEEYDLKLQELGINISNVTAAEFERLKVILQEKGILEDAIKRFQAFGEGLRGLIDKLQLGFDLLETTDPAEKLAELVKALTETFAFAIPSRFQDLNEFLLAGFDALKNGGQALIDFLIEAGLEELTAEEFADLLKLLDEFQDGVGNAAQDAGDALAEFLEKLRIDVNILDIDDPVEKLKFFNDALKNTFGAVIPQTFEGMKQFILDGFAALRGDAEGLKAFLASVGLEELTAEQFQELLLSLEELLDGITVAVTDVFAGLIDRLNLEFELFNVDDPVEKMKKLLAGFVELFGFFPEGIDTVRDFIDQGFAALVAGGDVLKTFLASVGLEELTAEQLEEFLKLLDQFQDEIDNAGGTVEKVTDKFAEFSRGFDFLLDILDVTDPIEKLRLFRNAVNTTFEATLPESFEEMKRFILDGFIALQGDAEALKIFLDRFGLGELTKEQFEDLLRELESGLDGLPRAFGSLIDRLNLEFKLLDIDDPLKKLDKLRKEIAKDFGAIVPETKEGIDELIRNGVTALLAGGDALKAFLASVDLEELTAEEFENFLEFLKGIADEVQKAAEEVGGAEEEIGISAIKAITFTQGNQLLNELATIREILTQELEIARASALADELEVEPDVVGAVDSFHTETSFYLNLIRDELSTIIDLMREGLTPVTGAEALSAFDTGSLTRSQSFQTILLVKGDTVSSIGFSDLEEVDRLLIEKGLSISRSRGLV
jgi:DNA repair exonuclease SbcCD ATPase subunit